MWTHERFVDHEDVLQELLLGEISYEPPLKDVLVCQMNAQVTQYGDCVTPKLLEEQVALYCMDNGMGKRSKYDPYPIATFSNDGTVANYKEASGEVWGKLE